MHLTAAERRVVLVAADLAVVNLALAAAAVLWTSFGPIPAALLALWKWFVTLSVVWLMVGSALDIYDPVRAASATYSATNSGLTALLAGGAYLMIPWFAPPLDRRLFAVTFVGLAVVGVVLWRAVYARVFYQPSFKRRVLVVGRDAMARRAVEALQVGRDAERANPFRGTGYEVVRVVEELPVAGGPALDPALSLMHLIRRAGVDEVMVAGDAGLAPEMQEALLDCRETGIPVSALPMAYERLTLRLPVDYAGQELRVIASAEDSPWRRLYLFGKRAFDLVLALVGLVLLALLMPLVAAGNALTSRGPLFYRQERVGRRGQPFRLVKFRTMVPEAENNSGAVWSVEDDPRVTPVGRWLRRTHLDELPQVMNVLGGEMSIVGPRPERPQFVGEITRELPIYRARHAVRPGLTGWAQIRYPYGSSVEDARCKLEYDLYYLKHAGLILDLIIVLRTIPALLRFDGR
jgi:exopolysaccharide biosynthesis polyprenyl glycosylphosphotransferase